jgi:hypothetical protein
LAVVRNPFLVAMALWKAVIPPSVELSPLFGPDINLEIASGRR